MAVTETSQAPPLFRRHVRRPRLTRLLAAAKSQVILITAPAGYGKTTLATEWLQGRDDVVWYRATSASADLAAFSAGLSDVVQPVVPGAGDRLKQRLRVAEAPEKAARPLAELLAEDVATWPKGALIVIDDYHLVADSAPVEEFVDWLLLLAPVRLVVTTRRRPKWASARRVLYGDLIEIGRDQLAMTHEEAAHVLGNRSSESVRELVAQAEGWPAVIGLAGLCASAEIPEESVSDALFRYFAEEVFRNEPEDVQEFMLRASLPASLDSSIVECLGIPDAEAVLQRLADDGLIYKSAPSEHRFHPLLREFLRWKIAADEPDALAEIAQAIIEMARRKRDWDTAFQLAITTGEAGLAAKIVGEASSDLFAAGRIETVENWLSECAGAALQEPHALLARVELLLRRGQVTAAADLARGQTKTLASDGGLLARTWILLGQTLHLVSDEEGSLQAHLAARELASGPDDRVDALWGAFLSSTVLELPNSAGYLDELDAIGATDVDSRLRVATGRVIAGAHGGSYSGVQGVIEPLVDVAEHANDPFIRSSFLARAAEIAIARCDYTVGLERATAASQLCRSLHLHLWAAFCAEIEAVAQIGLRRFGLARRTLARLRDAAHEHEDPYVLLAAKIVAVRASLAQGLRFVPDEAFTFVPAGLQKATVGEFHGLLALAAAARGDRLSARREAEYARELTNGVDARCYAGLADLIVSSPARQREMGLGLVRMCIEVGFPHGLVVGYRAYPPLLSIFAAHPEAVEQVGDIVRRAGDLKLMRETGVPLDVFVESEELLTRRELEILTLLADGLTNAKIARRLVISESTVKVHVHHILRKLGVRTRLEAVLKSQQILDQPN